MLENLVQRFDALTEEISTLETILKEKKKELDKLVSEQMIDVLFELGIQQGKLDDGRTFKVQLDCYPSIKDPNKFEEYLIETKNEAILKHKLSIDSDRSELPDMLGILDQYDIAYDLKKSVHPQTLKAFAREHFGQDVPGLETFSKNVVKFRKARK